MEPGVRVFEVGPRDGLQNEQAILPVSQRVELIHKLVEAGSRDIEIGSFVHPKWVPQMAASDEVARQIARHPDVNYWALVPNIRGLERALEADVTHLAFFISASETHNHKNLNRSIGDTLAEIQEMFEAARGHDIVVRAYISMVFGCPYEGEIPFERVLEIGETLRAMGVDIISLGDTIGIGTPPQMMDGGRRAVEAFGVDGVALHLHDTRGLGVTNAMVAYQAGMRLFDSSVGGIGGCPYAPGAAGNLGTEDLIYLMDSMGVETGLEVSEISEIAHWLETQAEITIPSRCTNYLQSQRKDL